MHVIRESALEKQRKIEFLVLEQVEWTKLQLYRQLARALGVSDEGDTHRVRSNVEQALQKRVDMGIEPLIILDDAHYLKPSAFDAIKHISDIEKNGKKICPVLILGYHRVVEQLKKGDLAQVADRIHLRRALNLFSQRDVFEYVARTASFGRSLPLSISYEFPIQSNAVVQAEAPRLAPFTLPAVGKIYELSRNPRIVRLICAEALKIQASESDALQAPARFAITAKTIERAWEAIKLREEARGE